MNKSVLTKELYECNTPYLTSLFENSVYPWDMLPKIGGFIKDFINSNPEGFTEISDGVFVGENVTIASTVTIEAPVVIGKGTVIRPGAFLRGRKVAVSGRDYRSLGIGYDRRSINFGASYLLRFICR